MRYLYVCALAVLAAISSARGDTVKIKGAGSIECVVIQENPEKITVQFGSGLLTFNRRDVESIVKSTSAVQKSKKEEKNKTPDKALSAPRLPAWQQIVERASVAAWGKDFEQIPATVIDKGVLKNVPYKSHRCGDNYEINVYGDPDKPAGFEIGIYKALLSDEEAKKNCADFVASLLGDQKDVAIVRMLGDEAEAITRADLVFEVTPPTADDSYGGWWISVYSEKELKKVRATDAELQEITVARITKPAPAQKAKVSTKEPDVRRSSVPADESKSASDEVSTDWSIDDIKRSRPPATTQSSDSSTGGGRVYVRGYYRKNGTYVKGHYRRK